MAQAFGEQIYGSKSDASRATAEAIFQSGFTSPSIWPSVWGTLGTLYEADEFWVEGVAVSFAQRK